MPIELGKIIDSHRRLVDWARTGFNSHRAEIVALDEVSLPLVAGNFFTGNINEALDKSNSPLPSNDFYWNPIAYQLDGTAYSGGTPPTDLSRWEFGDDFVLGSGVEGQTAIISRPLMLPDTTLAPWYDNYVMDIEISVKDVGVRPVGIVIAVEPLIMTGEPPASIVVVRSPGFNGVKFAAYKHYMDPNQRTLIADKSHTCTWGNGANGSMTASQANYNQNNASHGWKGQIDKYGPDAFFRIRVERDGQRIKIYTTDFNKPEVLIDDPIIFNMMDLDLSSSLRFDSSRYGFYSNGQGNVKWKYRTLTDLDTLWYDYVNYKTYRIVDRTAEDVTDQHSITQLGGNIMLYSRHSKRLFLLAPNGAIYEY